MNTTESTDAAQTAGAVFGRLVIFPLLVYLIGYGIIRLVKKRAPTRKETFIILGIAFFLVVVSAVGQINR